MSFAIRDFIMASVKIIFNAEDAEVFAKGAEEGFTLRTFANASASSAFKQVVSVSS